MRFVTVFAAISVLLVRPLAAEESPPVELTIRARAIETPVLKYRLLPAEAELKPGNAAPILLRMPWEQTAWMNQVFPTLHEWETRPLDAPEWAASGGVLPEHFFREMRRAAFRRTADWEYPIGEAASLYTILLPDVQGLRVFIGRGLVARIRYYLSRGELEQAREGILIGLADGRHLAQTPFYVCQLVAIAIHRTMLDQTGELISQPDSPNFYWALSALPDSLISLDRTASLEADAFARTLPVAADLDGPRNQQEWRNMARQLVELLKTLDELPEARAKDGASTLDVLAKWTAVAREELPELANVSAAKVTAMSDAEASVRWYVHQRLAIDHRAAAAVVLPPREAWPLLRQLRQEVKSLHEKTGTTESGFFDPTLMYVSPWSINRKIQALRIIEATRHYMAAHEGKLPAALDDITEVPIPLDPLTGEPFSWKVSGETALLEAPPLPAWAIPPDSTAARVSVVRYRLTAK
jgi:hypothetical protein